MLRVLSFVAFSRTISDRDDDYFKDLDLVTHTLYSIAKINKCKVNFLQRMDTCMVLLIFNKFEKNNRTTW